MPPPSATSFEDIYLPHFGAAEPRNVIPDGVLIVGRMKQTEEPICGLTVEYKTPPAFARRPARSASKEDISVDEADDVLTDLLPSKIHEESHGMAVAFRWPPKDQLDALMEGKRNMHDVQTKVIVQVGSESPP